MNFTDYSGIKKHITGSFISHLKFINKYYENHYNFDSMLNEVKSRFNRIPKSMFEKNHLKFL